MKARLKYRLTALDYRPACEIEVFEDSSDERVVDFAIGKTFAEAKGKVITRIHDRLSRRGDPSLEIPPSEEIELEI